MEELLYLLDMYIYIYICDRETLLGLSMILTCWTASSTVQLCRRSFDVSLSGFGFLEAKEEWNGTVGRWMKETGETGGHCSR